jgi:peptide/nickel transport system ATP-binding protein
MAARLQAVRLDRSYLRRYPDQLSGGEKQRVAIARALAGDPRLVVCDETVSALDVSVQAAILNLLADLQREQGYSYLFITHSLGVVRQLAARIGVIYLGRFVEQGTVAQVFQPPYHPYTEALLSSVPIPQVNAPQKRIRLAGSIPSALNPPSGCPFHTRCHRKIGEICEREEPPWRDAGQGHNIYCHIPLEELRTIEPVLGD